MTLIERIDADIFWFYQRGATLRLCALARMSLLIQAVVLAKAQRRKGRKGKILVMVGLNTQRPSTHGGSEFFFTSRQRRLNLRSGCRGGSIVADATRMSISRPSRGLKPTAKLKSPLRGGRKMRKFCFPRFN